MPRPPRPRAPRTRRGPPPGGHAGCARRGGPVRRPVVVRSLVPWRVSLVESWRKIDRHSRRRQAHWPRYGSGGPLRSAKRLNQRKREERVGAGKSEIGDPGGQACGGVFEEGRYPHTKNNEEGDQRDHRKTAPGSSALNGEAV